MDPDEAERHFEWFVSLSGPRRKLLLKAVAATGGNVAACNYTPESLIPLWKAMARFFEARPMTEIEREQFADQLPHAAFGLKKFANPRDLTTASLCYAIDIGFYFAEVFLRTYPQVCWALCKEKGHAFHKPALVGFKLILVPADLVKSCIRSELKQPKDSWLFDA